MAAATLTFHKDPALKERLLDRIAAHEQADAIAKGAYEKWNGGVHRCAVGCSVRDLGDKGALPANWHAEYERVLGIPMWLAYLEDAVFERLPDDAAKGWPRRFSEAVPVGVSLDGLADRLAVRRLREECLPLSGFWPESIRAEVVAAIEQVIAALEMKGSRDVSAARSAKWSARSAWRSSAESAKSAKWAARSAAWSAESAKWSARSAARSAAWSAAESAKSAAESAKSAAAESAWSAAWSAESAAWSAAWSAEESVWSAARSAESAAYEREASRIVGELERIGAEVDA